MRMMFNLQTRNQNWKWRYQLPSFGKEKNFEKFQRHNISLSGETKNMFDNWSIKPDKVLKWVNAHAQKLQRGVVLT